MQRSLNQPPTSDSPTQTKGCTLAFADGLFGYETAKDLTLVRHDSEVPFGWLESAGENGPSFLVVKPQDVGQPYLPEISREDARLLGLDQGKKALILSVVTQHDNGRVTINLKSPIVVNLELARGKQIIPRNISSFTSQYPLDVCAA